MIGEVKISLHISPLEIAYTCDQGKNYDDYHLTSNPFSLSGGFSDM